MPNDYSATQRKVGEKLARDAAMRADMTDCNYRGSTYTVEAKGRKFEVVVTIQDTGKPTPHDFRAMAEANLKESETKVDQLQTALRVETTLCEGWSHRAQHAEKLLQRTLDYFGESGMPEDLLASYKAVRGVES